MEPELYTITSGYLTAQINPIGAELWSLRTREGHEFMKSDDAEWANRAPFLFPIVGSLCNDRYEWEGQEYEMKRHGFARKSRFEVLAPPSQYGDIVFTLRESEETLQIYPFPFELRVSYHLGISQLRITVNVLNTGSKPMPFCFGFHPAFAWPLPMGGAKEDHTLRLDTREAPTYRPAPVYRLNEQGLLVDKPLPSPMEGMFLRLRRELFEDDALIYRNLNQSHVLYQSGARTNISLTSHNCPDLGIWQVPGADFICIEPWRGHADIADRDIPFRDKPRLVILDRPQGVPTAMNFELDIELFW